MKKLSRRNFITGGIVAAAGAAVAVGTLRIPKTKDKTDTNTIVSDTRPQANRKGTRRYIALEKSGELARREEKLFDLMSPCKLCPRDCGAARADGRMAACRTADKFRVASFGPHHGEEGPLRGRFGSGTIFFSMCNLLCVFCLNYPINHKGQGRYTTHRELADMMLNLQARGCHNINFVTPTHVLPHIVKALRLAINDGLDLPIVYNSSGYEHPEIIKLLDGIVDIYLPDFKFQDSAVAARVSRGASDYPAKAAASIIEMHRQVGNLQTDANGVATQGVLIRHLVMPENMAGTDTFVKWVVLNLGTDAHVNIMGQYRPMFRARYYPPLNRSITQAEFAQAMEWAYAAGLRNFH